MDNNQKALSHFGVPGMKWGVRKASPKSALRTAYKKSVDLGIKTWVGNVLSSDTFYQEELVAEQANKLWMKYGVMAAEMEAASLLTLAKKYNARALAMMT